MYLSERATCSTSKSSTCRNLSRDLRVGDAGDISYPLIPGRIQAAGLTVYKLEEKMRSF